jgi:hypothetical protein
MEYKATITVTVYITADNMDAAWELAGDITQKIEGTIPRSFAEVAEVEDNE